MTASHAACVVARFQFDTAVMNLGRVCEASPAQLRVLSGLITDSGIVL